MEDTYRSAASVLVLRPLVSEDGTQTYQLLLLHKPRKRDAWQLPQGGVEAGENLEQAALRELREEAGISPQMLRVIGKSEKVYQYDFPASFRRFRPDHICGQRIEYLFTIVTPDVQVKVDNKEIDGFLWADLGQVPEYVKRKEYLSLVLELIDEVTRELGGRNEELCQNILE